MISYSTSRFLVKCNFTYKVIWSLFNLFIYISGSQPFIEKGLANHLNVEKDPNNTVLYTFLIYILDLTNTMAYLCVAAHRLRDTTHLNNKSKNNSIL